MEIAAYYCKKGKIFSDLKSWTASIFEPKAHKVSLKYRWSAVRQWSVHAFKLEYLSGQAVSLNHTLCVASLGVGKGCLGIQDRCLQNYGFHGNRKCPLTYNGESGVSTLTPLVLIISSSNLHVTRTGIKSQTSSNFGRIGTLPS